MHAVLIRYVQYQNVNHLQATQRPVTSIVPSVDIALSVSSPVTRWWHIAGSAYLSLIKEDIAIDI